jgi:predicted LPLAT superfamily acyltransferase
VNKRPQWEGRTHGGSLGQKGLLYFFRYTNYTLGKILLYPILCITVLFYMIFSYRGFQSIWFYFRKIHKFGILKSLYRTFLNHFLFGENLFDKFALFTGENKAFKVTITGQELFDEVINSPKGAIIASSHVGNFEISGYILRQTKKRINGIIYGEENPVIQQFRNEILEKNNVFQIPVAGDLSHIITINNVLSKGEILTMPCDRIFTGNKTIELEFLGKVAAFPTGAYHLAVKYDIPVLTLFVLKESLNHYHLYLNRIDNYGNDNLSVKEKIELLARNYVSELEKTLKRFPEQWYNFYKFWKSE